MVSRTLPPTLNPRMRWLKCWGRVLFSAWSSYIVNVTFRNIKIIRDYAMSSQTSLITYFISTMLICRISALFHLTSLKYKAYIVDTRVEKMYWEIESLRFSCVTLLTWFCIQINRLVLTHISLEAFSSLWDIGQQYRTWRLTRVPTVCSQKVLLEF